MAFDYYRVRIGGLMRCCIATIDVKMVAATKPPKDGDTMSCLYCKDGRMCFRDDAWEWDQSGN